MVDRSGARAAALKRVSARRDLAAHAFVYVVTSLALVVIWLVTGAGYFWPGWAVGGWGLALAFNAWAVYGRRPISEEDIVREMERTGGSRR